MSLIQLQIVIGFAGLLNGVVLMFYLFLSRSGNIKANRILAFMVLAAVLKISFAFSTSEMHLPEQVYFTFYLLAMSGYYAIAPLMWLYFKAITAKDYRFNPFDLVHLGPSFYVLLIPLFKLSPFIFSLWIAQAQIFAYIVLSAFHLRKLIRDQNLKSRRSEYTIMRNILIGVILLWADVFLLIENDFAVFYLLELCMLFTIIVYVLVYSAIKQVWIKRSTQNINELKYNNSKLDDIEADEILNRLKTLMENERPYENPDITLPKLSKYIDVSPHRLSEVINRKTEMNFAEYINQYRVEKAKELLMDPENMKYKIASIAYDCGFNTLSTFNLAFKKTTNVTPSVFRNEMIFQN